MTETVASARNAAASRGQCKPGASTALVNITPELQAEPAVCLRIGVAGPSPLTEERMLVRLKVV